MRNVTTFPPLPELKSLKILFPGETMNEGVFSLAKGLKPLKLDPDFFKLMKSPITSTISAESKILAMVSCGINFF